MGISSANLYNAVGDKRPLQRAALDRYVALGFEERSRHLEAQFQPRQAINGFFAEIVTLSLADPDCKGCLIANMAVEAAPHDPTLRNEVAAIQGRMESFFLRCIEAGRRDGTVTAMQPAGDFACLLLGLLMRLRVLARSRPGGGIAGGNGAPGPRAPRPA